MASVSSDAITSASAVMGGTAAGPAASTAASATRAGEKACPSNGFACWRVSNQCRRSVAGALPSHGAGDADASASRPLVSAASARLSSSDTSTAAVSSATTSSAAPCAIGSSSASASICASFVSSCSSISLGATVDAHSTCILITSGSREPGPLPLRFCTSASCLSGNSSAGDGASSAGLVAAAGGSLAGSALAAASFSPLWRSLLPPRPLRRFLGAIGPERAVQTLHLPTRPDLKMRKQIVAVRRDNADITNWRVSGSPIFFYYYYYSRVDLDFWFSLQLLTHTKDGSARAMADAASRAGHVQAAAGAAGLSSWRRRPLAHPQAAHAMLARQAERPQLPASAAQGLVMRRPMVMASSAQAGCQAPARAQSAGAILAATRVPPLRVVLGPADPDGRRGVTRAPAPLSGGVPAVAPRLAPLGRPALMAAPRQMAPHARGSDGRGALSAGGATSRARSDWAHRCDTGLAQLERPPRMAAPLAAPMLARKRELEALGCVPQPLPRPPSHSATPAGASDRRVRSGSSDGGLSGSSQRSREQTQNKNHIVNKPHSSSLSVILSLGLALS
eukprot:scaffold133_cov103-Isochrysis_galbana.AAC.4